jgi:phosphoribosylaminoimidazole-succinocarboxamide synthase
MNSPVLRTDLPGLPVRRGKVRDVYDLGETLLLVSTDRISAFDWILPTGIPDKGAILTQLSAWWFARSGEQHHLLSTAVADFPLPANVQREQLTGRASWVKKTQVVPIECVVRGYLVGSGWKEYRTSGTVCGIALPSGLREGDQLPTPIFTPATKAESGHDENISFDQMVNQVGSEIAEELLERSIVLYERGATLALEKGIIIADTKFEWGQLPDESLILIDEVLTPDSSRFWPADDYRPGQAQPSFDKQYVRDWLERSGWDKNSPPPELPVEIVTATRARYVEAYERLTGEQFQVR